VTKPYVVFVWRITRQKGIVNLLEAARYLTEGVGLVLCAGQADTDDLLTEVEALVTEARTRRSAVTWIQKMLPRPELIQILSHARAFVCPSIYEPFGIVNLEAMACETPVVASAVGGIPEVVEHGRTGFLVPLEPDGTPLGAPRDREAFARALASRIDELVANPDRARAFGRAARMRVEEHFSWTKIAEQTAALYRGLLERHGVRP
jgi:alpha-maltose-1-phosphate synthase